MIFKRYNINFLNFLIERGGHRRGNPELIPSIKMVQGKNKTYMAIRYINPKKELKNHLEKAFNKEYDNISKDFEYINKGMISDITQSIFNVYINVNKLNLNNDMNLKELLYKINDIHDYDLKNDLKKVIGLSILASGINFLPELENKSLQKILSDKNILEKINIKINPDILHLTDNNEYGMMIDLKYDNKFTLNFGLILNDKNKTMFLENYLIKSHSTEKVDIENLIMKQVAFMEFFKSQIGFKRYKINGTATSNPDRGMIGAGVWLKRGFSTNIYDLHDIYKNVMKYFFDNNKTILNETNFNEFEELIDYMVKNNINSASKDFKTWNKFLNFKFITGSSLIKQFILQKLNNIKKEIKYSNNHDKILNNKLYSILDAIELKVKNGNKIELFDILKIIHNSYEMFIDNKNKFLNNLLASKL